MSALPPARRDPSYEEIRDAVGATARGRWFLDEHARRSRQAETGAVMEAVARLGAALAADGPARDRPVAEASGREAAGLAELRPALDAVATDIAAAASRLAEEAEALADAAWTLRESGAAAGLCDRIDDAVVAIAAEGRALAPVRLRALGATLAATIDTLPARPGPPPCETQARPEQ